VRRVVLVFILCLVFLVPACTSKKPPRAVPPVPVNAAAAVIKTIPVQLKAIGTVEAYQTISVRTQITAEIQKVHFREGQDVKKGDLLIELDRSSTEATLRQAEANLARDRAQAKHAQEQARRYGDLVKKDYIAKEIYNQIVTNAASLEATVKADEAVVENTRIQLRFCSIHAPIDGRIGKLLVDQGNIAKANDMELFTINQVQPVNVAFSIPEKDLARVKEFYPEHRLEMEASGNDGQLPEKGELAFVDNAIDKTTGTITLKGTFANRERRLWPGQFVNVVLTLSTQPDAVLVPTKSIEQGQEGQYVYVIKPGSLVEMRTVRTGESYQDETVILQGLKAGEQVVTDGQLRLTPGAKITIKEAQKHL
jgi:membrane fusion protein, multidrug efflux system